MNLLETTKVNTFWGFTKENKQIFKKKLFPVCKSQKLTILVSSNYHEDALQVPLMRARKSLIF